MRFHYLTTLKSSILKYPFGLKSFLRLYFSDQMLIPQMNNPLYSFLVNHLHYPYMHIRIFLFLSFSCKDEQTYISLNW